MPRKILRVVLWTSGWTLFGLLVLETAVRLISTPSEKGPALNLINRHAPYFFSLNPEHPEISSQGFRDRERIIPKPPGQKRVLVLGDSVAYGLFVSAEQAFPHAMERFWQSRGQTAEVINAGVNGYTTFSELKFFQARGAALGSDDVVLAFCFNDIVNPVLHWGDEKDYFKALQREAFPRFDEHVRRVAPEVYRKRSLAERVLMHSKLYTFLRGRWRLWRMQSVRYEGYEGKKWPVYVADEDTVSLRALENPASPESEWLYGMLRELKTSVEGSGARFHVVFFPLAYQFKNGYPFFPQKTLMQFCGRENISCLDPFEALRRAGGESLYLGRHAYHPRDVWHLSPEGHAAAAEIIASWLSAGFTPKEAA